MVVQHNLTAMNSNRMLGITQNLQAKSSEKLSSGYRINRAADDAAGLAISEKMRKQINGLDQASTNAQDGVSAVQTAEGALTEVHSMLQRMNELAVQAANGTNSEDDRTAIQLEIDQLVDEIDRVAETTKFNETYLLKGDKNVQDAIDYQYKTTDPVKNATLYTLEGSTYTEIASDADLKTALEANKTIYSQAADAGTAATSGTAVKTVAFADQFESTLATSTPTDIAWADNAGKKELDLSNAATGKITIAGVEVPWDTDAATTGAAVVAKKDAIIADSNGTITNVEYDSANSKIIVTGADNAKVAKVDIFTADGTKKYSEGDTIADADITTIGTANQTTYYTVAPTAAEVAEAGVDYTLGGITPLYDKDGNKISENGLYAYFDEGTGDYKGGLYTDDTGLAGAAVANIDTYVDQSKMKEAGALTLKLHVGADATENNQITIDIDAMSAKGMGVDGLKVDGADDTNALDAIETIKAAIQLVSKQRSNLGAVQNRLEHTIANLDNVVENTTAAESRIRDTDMAEEMVEYSKNNILAQAGQSMLAQANQSTQGVLSLLG